MEPQHTNSPLTLVILAAGMGSRYGGLKQVDRLGPSGETITDYAVFDALRAGFGKLVLVIRKSIEQDFLETFRQGFLKKIPYEFVYQELDVLPEGFTVPASRTKPWGTAHALWVARHVIPGDFVVANADDFYGKESYASLAEFLQQTKNLDHAFAMCGYQLSNTLSAHGTVSRGVCQKDQLGNLISVVEHLKIGYNQQGRIISHHHNEDVELQEDTIVSMNIWAFRKSIFPIIESYLIDFLKQRAEEPASEFFTPLVADMLIRDKKGTVKVIDTSASWFGVTYTDDKPTVQQRLRDLAATGDYPSPLWK